MAATDPRGDPDQILYRVEDKVAVITLNRPHKANAQTLDLLDDLNAAWEKAAADEDVRVIVLNANGKHFSSGHDLSSGAPRPGKLTLEHLYQLEARRFLGYSPRLAQHPQALVRRRPGQVHRGRPAARLAVRPDHRGRERRVLRPGRVPGDRRRRVPRAGQPGHADGAADHRGRVSGDAVGAGLVTKLLNNLLFTAHLGTATSLLSLAESLAVDPARLAEIIKHGSGNSFALERVALVGGKLEVMGQVAGPLLQKDVRLLADVAAAGVAPGTVLTAADDALGLLGFKR